MKNVSLTKIVVATAVFLIGTGCGVLNCMDKGLWAIMKASGSHLESLLGGTVSVFSMVGNAANYVATRGDFFSPWFFWLGQLTFYSFVSISILRLRIGSETTIWRKSRHELWLSIVTFAVAFALFACNRPSRPVDTIGFSAMFLVAWLMAFNAVLDWRRMTFIAKAIVLLWFAFLCLLLPFELYGAFTTRGWLVACFCRCFQKHGMTEVHASGACVVI